MKLENPTIVRADALGISLQGVEGTNKFWIMYTNQDDSVALPRTAIASLAAPVKADSYEWYQIDLLANEPANFKEGKITVCVCAAGKPPFEESDVVIASFVLTAAETEKINATVRGPAVPAQLDTPSALPKPVILSVIPGQDIMLAPYHVEGARYLVEVRQGPGVILQGEFEITTNKPTLIGFSQLSLAHKHTFNRMQYYVFVTALAPKGSVLDPSQSAATSMILNSKVMVSTMNTLFKVTSAPDPGKKFFIGIVVFTVLIFAFLVASWREDKNKFRSASAFRKAHGTNEAGLPETPYGTDLALLRKRIAEEELAQLTNKVEASIPSIKVVPKQREVVVVRPKLAPTPEWIGPQELVTVINQIPGPIAEIQGPPELVTVVDRPELSAVANIPMITNAPLPVVSIPSPAPQAPIVVPKILPMTPVISSVPQILHPSTGANIRIKVGNVHIQGNSYGPIVNSTVTIQVGSK